MLGFPQWTLLDEIKMFCLKLSYIPVSKLKYSIANKAGLWFAAPKKYFQKELNDKQIFNLGAPIRILKNGNTVYGKSFSYKFNGKMRTTNVFTNLDHNNTINKQVVKTREITADAEFGTKVPDYGTCFSFDKKGDIISYNRHYSYFQDEEKTQKFRKSRMESNDGLVMRFTTYLAGKDKEKFAHVSLTPAGRPYFSEIFRDDKITQGVKLYIEKRRQELGSPKSMKSIRSALPYKDPVIRL